MCSVAASVSFVFNASSLLTRVTPQICTGRRGVVVVETEAGEDEVDLCHQGAVVGARIDLPVTGTGAVTEGDQRREPRLGGVEDRHHPAGTLRSRTHENFRSLTVWWRITAL